VAPRVPHETDVYKTDAKKKRGKKERDGEDADGVGDEGGDDEVRAVGRKGKKKPRLGDVQPENKKLTPIERAQEQRRKRLLLIRGTSSGLKARIYEEQRSTIRAFFLLFLLSFVCALTSTQKSLPYRPHPYGSHRVPHREDLATRTHAWGISGIR